MSIMEVLVIAILTKNLRLCAKRQTYDRLDKLEGS